MKILFVSCYTNNAHYINYTKKLLDKNLINCSYDFICLNDAPDTNNGDENYLNIVDMLSGETNSYEKIYNETIDNNFIHIKIPQSIHIKDRPNHGGPRHIENLNWFNQNIEKIFPLYKEYDYICHIDSDAFFCEFIDLNKELDNCDLAGPFIYIYNGFYIHTGCFFINTKTVTNMKNINWNNTMGTDTGSDIFNFIKNNPQYKIKKLGHYDGYNTNYWKQNNHTIFKLEIPDIDDNNYKLIDKWFNEKVIHFRSGSCFGVGSLKHRNENRLFLYNKKWEAFINLFNI